MQYEVYADLLFLINFSMDFLCLFLTARILRRRLRMIPALLASILGGLYSVIALFINTSKLLSVLTDIAVCSAMCTICFAARKQKTRQYLYAICIYLACAATLGGIMTALFNMLNKLNLEINSGGDNISSWLFLLLALVSGFAAVRGTNFLRRMPSGKTADAEIIFDGKHLTLHGMTDTGNILRDPASGKSVIITDVRATLPILPDAVRQAVVSGDVEHLGNLPPNYSGRIRLIPSETISGRRLLIGLVPDKILIHNEHGSSDVPAIFAPATLPELPNDCTAIIPGDLNI